jgi:hypothetical protein
MWMELMYPQGSYRLSWASKYGYSCIWSAPRGWFSDKMAHDFVLPLDDHWVEGVREWIPEGR